ncbi:hypothetical protein CLV62_101366 [Dysgonomonas alginatilytica]|uniref:Lipocalin-like protein n=1 Tax=Dysgonomonas alginatilytica TaxID=1605892 RepID=A0A2V3PTN8_9BACT|nr:hypothetical protein [Dysgonomonas alginatilytica]PXV69097.1 hypothetical protein CLV62_101366 [Dysgonomonas alginatilytica]
MSVILKRIFCFLLPVLVFTSCNEDTQGMEVLNPVYGVWNNYYQETDSLVMTRVFTSDFYSYFTYAEGKVQNEMNKQHYVIDETQIMLDQYTQTYRMKSDTLWITNRKGDQTTKYIRAD